MAHYISHLNEGEEKIRKPRYMFCSDFEDDKLMPFVNKIPLYFSDIMINLKADEGTLHQR
jgi:hypothetical protein